MKISEFLLTPHSRQPFLAVLGYPIRHSRSPLIHNAALQYFNIKAVYYALETPPSEISQIHRLLSSPHFRGANVTIPLKKEVFPYLQECSEAAIKTGAVNTILLKSESQNNTENRILAGDNTDVHGFIKPLEAHSIGKSAAILGYGGSASAVIYALKKSGVETLFIFSRSGEKKKKPLTFASLPEDGLEKSRPITSVLSYDHLEEVLPHVSLVVNTTPLGMHPLTFATPVPEKLLPLLKGKICYDIIYNPLETLFIKQAGEYGAEVITGLDMFINQAIRSFELWFSRTIPEEWMRDLLIADLTS